MWFLKSTAFSYLQFYLTSHGGQLKQIMDEINKGWVNWKVRCEITLLIINTKPTVTHTRRKLINSAQIMILNANFTWKGMSNMRTFDVQYESWIMKSDAFNTCNFNVV